MDFEFSTSNRIIFKTKGILELGNHALKLGTYPFIVTGKNKNRLKPLLAALKQVSMDYVLFSVEDEPDINQIREAVKLALDSSCNMVIGFGGGSALDSAKAIAILMNNPGDILDYLEIIGKNQEIKSPHLPLILIPTTSGTGSEVTKNSVLTDTNTQIKVSLRSPMMLADLVFIDPALTVSMPPQITSSTGLDALTQVIEPFVSSYANPITDTFCREGIKRISSSLKKAYQNGNDITAREDMALGSLFGGLALANSKLGAVHGFAGVIGGKFGAPHGFICAALLPNVIKVNINALKSRNLESQALSRYTELSQILLGKENALPEDCLIWLEELYSSLKVEGLSKYGITQDLLDEIIEKSASSSSMKGNPITLTYEEMKEILVSSL